MSILTIIAQALVAHKWRVAKPLQYVIGRGRSAILPLGARLVFAGDSKFATQGSPGQRSIQLQTIDRLNGRARMAVAGDQGISGNTVADLAARLNYVIGQQADITVVGIGHNSLAASDIIAQLQAIHSALRAGLGNKYIIWTTVLPSATSPAGGLYPADNTTLVAVNDWIVALDGTDGFATRAVNFGYKTSHSPRFDPVSMCYAEGPGTQYIHPNARGAEFTSGLLASVIDQIVTSQSLAEALADTGAAREHGANVDQLYLLASGTAGTKAGATLPTGNVVTGANVTNSSTATVACSIDAVGGYSRQIIDITGNVTAEATVVFNRQNISAGRVPINGIPGDIFELLCGYQLTHSDGVAAPVGVLQYGHILSLSRARLSVGAYTATDSMLGAVITEAKGPRVARTQAGLVRSATANLATTADEFGIRLAAGAVNVRLIIWLPIARKTDLDPYTAPFYMGGDGIQGTSERVGNSAGLSALVAGTSYTWQPGLWSGGGVTVSNLIETSVDGVVWTTATTAWVWVAAGTSGTMVRQTVTAINELGGVTQTSSHTIA